MAEPTKVFISYSHDDADHASRVLRLAERLRSEGVDAWVDQYEPAPDRGWRQWMLERIRWADFVLMICTETYRRRAEGVEKEGRGLGAVYETTLLLDELYDAGMRSERLVPVLFQGASRDDVPAGSKQLSRYRLPLQYEDLYRRLTRQPKIVPRPLGTPRVLAPDVIALEESAEGAADTPRRSTRTTESKGPDQRPPLPHYRDEHARRIETELRTAVERRRKLLGSNEDTAPIDARILGLERELGQALDAGPESTTSTLPEPARRIHLPPPPITRSGREKTSDLFRKVTTKDGEVDLWCEIPAGEGWIGSPEGVGLVSEHPRHRVEVRRRFWMMAVPVTNAIYEAMDPNRADSEKPDHPVVGVSWYRAMEVCRWLADEQGFEGARLPTEEEWEYACRAGSETRYWKGDAEEDLAEVGWYSGNSNNEIRSVGEKLANPWGLYDVHGNVSEWTATTWSTNRYRGRSETEPFGIDPTILPKDLTQRSRQPRAFRGGSSESIADRARSARREKGLPGFLWLFQGFRVLLPCPPSGG